MCDKNTFEKINAEILKNYYFFYRKKRDSQFYPVLEGYL